MVAEIKKILLLDNVDPICGKLLTQAGLEVTEYVKLSKSELVLQLKSHDAVVVRSATKMTAEVVAECGRRLQLVGRAGTGVDNIDVEAATRRGLIVMNTPGGNTLSAAEHTCAMMCALARSLPQACASLKEGRWDRKLYMGNELSGKILAIIGLGRIGREVAKRMQSFDMTTIGYDPLVSADVSKTWGIESVPLDELWTRADYVTLHVPLLPHTQNLVNEKVLKSCKPGVKIVNVARGGIVDEAALLKALEDGTCGGAALDVFLEEPPTDFTLCKHPKVICTPHLGANTIEAQKRVAVEIAQQIIDTIIGRPLVGVVNAPALTNSTSHICKPWIELGMSLGLLANKLSQPSDLKSININIELYGKVVSSMSIFLGSAVLMGLMKGLTTCDINLVNAPLLAEEMGVSMSVVVHSDKGLDNLHLSEALVIKVAREQESVMLTGSVLGSQPTLFSLDGCSWNCGLSLCHNMLFYRSTPSVTLLESIVNNLIKSEASIMSLTLSTVGTKYVWYVAQTHYEVKGATNVGDGQFVTQVSF